MKYIIQVSIVILSIIIISPGLASAGTAGDAGWGIGSILASCVYSPIKLVYATLGGVTGGLAYLLTGFNSDVANAIWVPSLRGTYVIAPEILKGNEPIQFVGRREYYWQEDADPSVAEGVYHGR